MAAVLTASVRQEKPLVVGRILGFVPGTVDRRAKGIGNRPI